MLHLKKKEGLLTFSQKEDLKKKIIVYDLLKKHYLLFI
jgi:hypothetical protein